MTALLGLAIALLVIARRVDMPFTRSRRWPGTFASGTRRQRESMMALLPLGLGLGFLGTGQFVGASNRWVAGALLVAAIVLMAVAMVMFARAGFTKTD